MLAGGVLLSPPMELGCSEAQREKTLQRGTWNTALQKHSQYSEAQLRECVEAIVAEQAKAPTASLHAVQKKYSHHKFGEVAKLPAPIL